MSSNLPVITSKQMIRALNRAGFLFKRQKGSHCTYIHPDRPGKIVVVPVHTKDLPKGTLKSILKQANLSNDELVELL